MALSCCAGKFSQSGMRGLLRAAAVARRSFTVSALGSSAAPTVRTSPVPASAARAAARAAAAEAGTSMETAASSGSWSSVDEVGSGSSRRPAASEGINGIDVGLRSPGSFCLSSTAFVQQPSVSVPEPLLNHLLETEAMYLSAQSLRAVTLQEILDCLDAYKVGKFIHSELPKRLAVRIRMIDNLRGWRKVPELVQVRSDMQKWFRMLRLVRRGADVPFQDFIDSIKTIKNEGKDVVRDMSVGMHKLCKLRGAEYTDEFVNEFLDDWFLIRIGSNMLVDQCIALAREEDGGLAKPTGVVDTQCDASRICEQAAEYAAMLCQVHTNKAPVYSIDTYMEGTKGPQTGSDEHMTFSHVPAFLRYIMMELLKNSFKATVLNCKTEEDIRRRPVRILVSSDKHHCAIRVSDMAGGIPYEVGNRIWSYLYGRAALSAGESPVPATPLAGYGVGLPISRLHARYLGGTLQITTFPGYGTDAALHLPIILSQQIEDLSGQVNST